MAYSTDSYVVNVRLLTDDEILTVDLISPDVNGRWLLDQVCENQDVFEERHYFGIRFIDKDMLSVPCKRWMDLSKSVREQLKGNRSVSFRFKHYPVSPMTEISQPKTQFYLYHQLRRDLATGRLITPPSSPVSLTDLAALVVQVHLGDYSANASDPGYLANFPVLHNQNQKVEDKIIKEHKELEGKLPFEAAFMLIEKACTLETYGVDPIRVKTKSSSSRRCHLGITPKGLVEFVNNAPAQLFTWNSVHKMSSDGKEFLIQTLQSDASLKKRIKKSYEFKCESKGVATSLLEWAVDSKIFYTALENPENRLKSVKTKRNFLSRSQTFKFAGRSKKDNARPGLSNTLPISGSRGDISYGGSMRNLTIAGTSTTVSSVNGVKLRERPNGVSGSSSRPVSMVGMGDASMNGFSGGKHSTLPRSFNPASVQNGAIDLLDVASTSYNESSAPSMSNGTQPIQLLGFFRDLPKRKFAPEAESRQRELIAEEEEESGSISSVQTKISDPVPVLGEAEEEESPILPTIAVVQANVPEQNKARRTYEHRFSDGDSLDSEEAVRELQSVAASGEAWANGKGPGVFGWFWAILPFRMGKEKEQTEVAKSQPLLSSTPNAKMGNHVASRLDEDDDDTKPVSKKRLALFSSGILLGLTAVGVFLILEADIYSPALGAIRGHPWMLDFESKCYRPMKSALTGLIHRSS